MKDTHQLGKIVRPALPSTILHREALVRRLNDVIAGPAPGTTEEVPGYKLVVLHAPAGYGKTSLLADFARRTTIPCCWYVLDRSDSDTITFLECLLMSIRSQFPQFGTTLDPLLAGARAVEASQSAEHRLETVVEALIDALVTEIPQRFALVLCNYHEVNESQEITALVNQLLRSPSSCVLVLESRTIPDLEFASLLTRREVFGMSSELFRLSAQEIRELAAIQGAAPLSDAEAEQLAAAFDGWMAGILLGTRLGDVRFLRRGQGGRAPFQRWGSSGVSVDRQLLFAYVVNEVFTHHPNEYAFLKDACVLQEMTPSLCAALLVLESADAAERLHALEQHGLFVTRSDAGAQMTYTCHPVLRDLLADALRRQAPERFAMLHQRAADLLRAAQDYEHAISHAHAAGADELATCLIIEASEQLFSQGHGETLARWIDALPATVRTHSPQLLLMRARLHCLAGDYPRALPLLTTAQEVIASPSSRVDPVELPTIQAEIALTKANVLFHRGASHEAQDVCRHVLDSLPPDEVALRAEAHMRLGVCAIVLGDFASSLTHLQQSLHLWGRRTAGQQVADVHGALVIAYNFQGNFALAEHHHAHAMACREQAHDVWGKVYDLIRVGALEELRGAFVEAESTLTEALTLARAMHLPRAQAFALANLGELYLDQGRYERSLAVTEEGLALARQVEDVYSIIEGLCTLAMTYLYMGDAVTAALLLSETDVHRIDRGTIGYYEAICELASSTIFYYQHHYDEARAALSRLEVVLQTMGFQRELLQARLRLAACYLAQGQIAEAMCCLEVVATTLATAVGYEQLALIELHRLPALEQMVKTRPEVARLRALLHLETEAPESNIPAQQMPQASPAPTLTTVQPPQLHIRALGEPTVLLREKPLTHWRMARAMELFFYLLDCGRPMRKEQIITALWPEGEEHTDHTFHSTVYYVRKALGESCIVSQKSTYTLDLASLYGNEVWYDVAAFQDEHARAGQALGREDDSAARTAFLAMVDLYRGDYVQPFYSDWCRFRRDALLMAYLDARRHLAQLAWRREEFDESTQHWQHMLAIDPCLEEAHYGLMRCYLRQGKRGLALRQYQRCRDALQQELGVRPGPTIQQLYQRLVESPAH